MTELGDEVRVHITDAQGSTEAGPDREEAVFVRGMIIGDAGSHWIVKLAKPFRGADVIPVPKTSVP